MPSYIIRNIDPDLWRAFKAAAALKGESMRDALLNAIRAYIAKHAKAGKS